MSEAKNAITTPKNTKNIAVELCVDIIFTSKTKHYYHYKRQRHSHIHSFEQVWNTMATNK